MSNYDQELVLDGSSCAWRMLKLSQALATLPRGATLRVTSSDPSLRHDLEALVRQTGHRVLTMACRPDASEFVIQKG